MNKVWKYGIPVFLLLLVVTIIVVRIQSVANTENARRKVLPLVRVEKPILQIVKHQMQNNGDVLPIRQAAIFSKISGNLERIYSDMGMSVRANQLLATIDSTELYQQYQQAYSTFQNSRLTYGRTKQLEERNLTSKQDIDNATTTMEVAKANYEAAATRLSYARITAPFSGVITKRFLDPGALVTANNATLFTLMNIDSVKIIVNVSENEVPYVHQVRTAVVKLDALPGNEFEGRVTRYSDAIDVTTRTMAVQVEIDNKSHIIKPGMFATVRMTVSEDMNAVTVPTNSILKDEFGQYVFVLHESRVKIVRVRTGVEQFDRTQVVSGLTGNEDIVTVGQQFVKDGESVNIER